MFPPGRARLATNPAPMGSLTCAMTMGSCLSLPWQPGSTPDQTRLERQPSDVLTQRQELVTDPFIPPKRHSITTFSARSIELAQLAEHLSAPMVESGEHRNRKSPSPGGARDQKSLADGRCDIACGDGPGVAARMGVTVGDVVVVPWARRPAGEWRPSGRA